jgi:AcrR family transcriptional regulator
MAEQPVTDARVRKTERRLREALVSLIHEKSYRSIVVREILHRADVGRSAFYAHFHNKDALLASAIEQMLHASPPRELPATVGRFRRALWFGFPVFTYIGGCRHAGAARMGRRGRAIVHQHLRHVLIDLIRDDVMAALQSDRHRSAIPAELVTEHVVATFMLVLNWWVDTQSPLSPSEIDDVFLTLVVPALNSTLDHAERSTIR